VLQLGKTANIVAIGSMVIPALEAAEILKSKGYDVGVINARFVKPLDTRVLQDIADRPIITVEENTLRGGFGTAVREILSSNTPILNIGIEDEFVRHGARSELLQIYGLTGEAIADRVATFLRSHK